MSIINTTQISKYVLDNTDQNQIVDQAPPQSEVMSSTQLLDANKVFTRVIVHLPHNPSTQVGDTIPTKQRKKPLNGLKLKIRPYWRALKNMTKNGSKSLMNF